MNAAPSDELPHYARLQIEEQAVVRVKSHYRKFFADSGNFLPLQKKQNAHNNL